MRENELYHHGILGMKWGIRRYQPYPKGHKGGKEVGEAARKTKPKRSEVRAQKRQQKMADKQAVDEITRKRVALNRLNTENTKYEKYKVINDANNVQIDGFLGVIHDLSHVGSQLIVSNKNVEYYKKRVDNIIGEIGADKLEAYTKRKAGINFFDNSFMYWDGKEFRYKEEK